MEMEISIELSKEDVGAPVTSGKREEVALRGK